MIKIIEGNLFDTEAKLICHQVNCQGKMGSGLALQVKQRFPHVYDEYVKACSEYSADRLLGQVLCVPCNPKYIGQDSGLCIIPPKEQFICNLFAQDNYGYDGKQYTSLEALDECFKKISWMPFERNNTSGAVIAMPYMVGCGRGGANWVDVYKMIEDRFKNCEVELWKYTPGIKIIGGMNK